MLPLSKLKVNQTGLVKNIEGDIRLKRRIFELGILPNETVEMLSVSPLKNSFLVAVKNYSLALRKQVAGGIMVEVI